MNTLLQLQELDLKIERLKAREKEIPRQKQKFQIHKERVAAELEESKERCKNLALEQREYEGDIEQKQNQVARYNGQLLAVRKNEEYHALLHEIDTLKKQISLKEERVIAIMVETDEATDHFEEDKKRIQEEMEDIASECVKIDEELGETIEERNACEARREPLLAQIDSELLSRYERIRGAKKAGPAIVLLNGESCSGCHMMVRPQIVNEVLAADKICTCQHCGRLLYHADSAQDG